MPRPQPRPQPRVITPSDVQFIRSEPEYRATYMNRVYRNQATRAALRRFMGTKRQNPQQMVSAEDTPFRSDGHFGRAIPGVAHAHLGLDLSIVYLVVGRKIFLYGFYTHDELGTGQPPNINKQKSMAVRFKNVTPGDMLREEENTYFDLDLE